MRASYFLIFLSVFVSVDAKAEPIFPLKPAIFKACYEAGQKWIREKMPELNANLKPSRYEFNADLATCSQRVPEFSNFKWPAEYEYRAKAPYKNFFTQDAAGNWIIASFIESSESPVTYLRIPKSGAPVQLISSVPINGYFFGFDFANYNLDKAGRAFGAQTAFLTKDASSIYFELLGVLEGTGRLFLQSTREVIAFDTQKKTWFSKKCLLRLEPAPKNDLPKIVETCRTIDAVDVASLTGSKAVARPNASRTFQWNGTRYDEGDPSEWLVKRNAPPVKFPAILTNTTKASPVLLDGLQIRKAVTTKTPKGRNPVVTVEGVEILKGLDLSAAKKINDDIAKTVNAANEDLMEPEVRDDDGKQTIHYGEFISKGELISFAKGVVVVRYSSSTMAPMNRSYDETSYVLYDAVSGARREPVSLFKSAREFDLFLYGASARFADKLDYLFPKRWLVKDPGLPTGALIVIPKTVGFEIILGDVFGGHYFDSSIGLIPTADVRALLKPGQLHPRVHCQAEMERPEEQRICREKLGGEYEALLSRWQAQLEQSAGDATVVEKISSDHAALLEKISACPEKDRACLKLKMDEQRTALH